MGYGNQVLFGCQFIGRMSPIAVGEDAELSAADKLREPFFQRREIADRTLRPGRKLLGQRRCLGGIGFEGGDDVYPVERMQLVKMDDMVVHI